MKILNQYIGKSLIGSILTVLLVLLGVESFIELAGELKDIGKGNFHITQAILNVPLMLPTDIYQLFPMAALIGSLMGLGKLASQSELIVMAAAGLSRIQIIRAMLQSALLLLIFVSLIGEVIAPRTQNLSRHSKLQAIASGQTIKTAAGFWFRENNNFVVVNDVLDNQLLGITRFKFDDIQQLRVVSHADKALFEKGQWNFYNVGQSEIFRDHIVSTTLPVQKWDIHLDKRLLGVSTDRPEEMTLTKLYGYIHYRQKNDLEAGLYEFEFWKRLLQPFATLVMIFIAVPFIFGPLRSVSMGLRILAGVIVGFGFYIMNQFFGPLSLVYQIPALFAALLPTVTFAILGTFLLFLKA